MAIYVYRLSDGTLYSWCPNDTDPVAPPSVLANNGFGMVNGLPPLTQGRFTSTMTTMVVWDSVNKTTSTVAIPPQPNIINWPAFINLFTPAEIGAIQGSTDNKVKQWLMAYSASPVDLNSTPIKNAVNYLVTAGLLSSSNAALILSGQPSG